MNLTRVPSTSRSKMISKMMKKNKQKRNRRRSILEVIRVIKMMIGDLVVVAAAAQGRHTPLIPLQPQTVVTRKDGMAKREKRNNASKRISR